MILHRSITSSLLVAACVMAASLCANASGDSGYSLWDLTPAPTVPTMEVYANGTAQAHPDTLRVTFRVVSLHETPTGALSANATALNKARNELERLDLGERSVTTGGLTIVAERETSEVDGRTVTGEIVRYVVSSDLHVRTSHIDKAGEILQTAVLAGANTIGSVEFTIADTDALRREAIADAARRAAKDAAVLADASGVVIGPARFLRVRSAEVDTGARESRGIFQAEASSVTPEFSPGLITVNVFLEAHYDVTPR